GHMDTAAEEEDEEHEHSMEISHYGITANTIQEQRIILHEDKKYYPEMDEVYPNIPTVTLDEDAQELEEPIIKPIKIKNFSVLEQQQPKLIYSVDYMTSLMNHPVLIRNVAILGQIHHGKTCFVDHLVKVTQEREWDPTKNIRY